MGEMKTYYIGWNSYSQKYIKYSSEEHAILSGTWWKAVTADSYKQAVEIFQEMYAENHSEIE
jgi:hypothetical protein